MSSSPAVSRSARCSTKGREALGSLTRLTVASAPGARSQQLRVVRLFQRPRRQRLAVPGGHDAAARHRFLIALAALSLLSEVAEERPLLCFVDDAQWLDVASAQVLGFVARRLLAESVAIVFAVREPSEERELAGLPELPLGGLDKEEAHALLARVIPGRLDERFRDRIVAETRGNPLALLER